jgi:hypothetical protein
MHHPRRRSWRTSSAGNVRLAIRFVTLALILTFGLWLGFRLAQRPELLAGLVPRPMATKTAGPRRAPFPDVGALKGAADRAPFLVENDQLVLPNDQNERGRLDADARYQLLLLAATAPEDALLADARTDLPLAALLEDPARHRGELLGYVGDLFAVKPLELRRDAVAGLERAWQALLAVDGLENRLLVLFIDWPPDWPPPQEMTAGAGPRVAAAGYFYKIVRIDHPEAGRQPIYLPVLVGRSLVTQAPLASPQAELPWVFLVMAVPVALLLALAWYWYRHGDRRLNERLALAQARQTQREVDGLTALEANRVSSPTQVSPRPPIE